jgi:serine/threonine protein kinase
MVLETNTRCFTYKELEEATNGFKDEAGRGSFGIVYRGMLPSGSKASIAVKKLDRVAIDAEKEFRAEVNTIGQTHHKNLVQLYGFCYEKQHRLLVYEYMSNGTLASLIFRDPKPSWNLRTQIATGISRAITYLHEECTTQIIHCDIKPQNILLDENYIARISDFGLAKLLVLNQSKTLTNIRGTRGYVAPEWFRNTQITAKVDVYSFGVMLLEIICCKRNIEDVGIGEDNVIILVDWVWDCFQEKRLDILVEDDLEALADWKTMERFVKVGIWCVQEDANLRPTMRKVSLMLEGIVEVSLPPCPDPFSSAT